MSLKRIYIASDHAGFNLKSRLKTWLELKGYVIKDFGSMSYNKNDDYPDFIIPLSRALSKAKDKNTMGIIIGKTGQGEAMVANKIKGIRAAVYYGKNTNILKLVREHNDANVLSLSGGFLSEKEAKKAISIFLSTNFSNAKRHKRRIRKFNKL